ncbi:MAG: LacI family DNA-binding transcriptional regulator [Boseongicola sp.]
MKLKELSALLGLSQTTVSRALNGYPEVSEATRRKVSEAAAAYNYRPNTRAKSLATGKSLTIGHVLPVSTKHEMVNPVFADFLAGAGETYTNQGYELLLSIVPDQEEEKVYRELASRGTVDGIIVHGPKRDDPRIALLRSLNMPFVVHGRATDIEQCYPWLDVNNRRAFYRATEFLIDLGHKRIALLNGLDTMDFAIRRREGYSKAMADRGLPIDPAIIFHDEMTETYGYNSAKRLLNSAEPPTAFVVSSVIPSIGVRRAVEESGLRFGKDISLVAYDDDLSYFRNNFDVPIFTAVRSSVRDAGRQAAQMLIDVIRGTANASHDILLEAELTVGRSTSPANSTGSVR